VRAPAQDPWITPVHAAPEHVRSTARSDGYTQGYAPERVLQRVAHAALMLQEALRGAGRRAHLAQLPARDAARLSPAFTTTGAPLAPLQVCMRATRAGRAPRVLGRGSPQRGGLAAGARQTRARVGRLRLGRPLSGLRAAPRRRALRQVACAAAGGRHAPPPGSPVTRNLREPAAPPVCCSGAHCAL